MPAESPLVSVVIPTYNYGQYVTEAVESALAQTYSAVEVIVVDDGSTDDTRERLAGYRNRIRYIDQKNQGLSAARNTGIRAANGEYIAFLDSDDVFHTRRLELQVPVLAGNPHVGLVASECTIGEKVFWEPLPTPVLEFSISLEGLVLRSRFGPSGVLMRKSCFDNVGFFNEELRSVEDRDMWIRVAARYEVVKLQASLWWYRLTPGSMSRNPERMEHFERVVLDKAFRMPELAGRWRLRRKAMGLASLASSWTFLDAKRPGMAIRRLIRSFVWWPLPFRKPETRERMVRFRLLASAIRRLFIPDSTASET